MLQLLWSALMLVWNFSDGMLGGLSGPRSRRVGLCLRGTSWRSHTRGDLAEMPAFQFNSGVRRLNGRDVRRTAVMSDTHEDSNPLRWHNNERDSVSNYQPHHCLLNRLFRCRSKKTSKLRVTGLCVGNSPVPGEFPAQMASYAENVSIWWRHHAELLKTMWCLPHWSHWRCGSEL